MKIRKAKKLFSELTRNYGSNATKKMSTIDIDFSAESVNSTTIDVDIKNENL